MQIRDLNSLPMVNNVKKSLVNFSGDLKVSLRDGNSRERRIAIAELNERHTVNHYKTRLAKQHTDAHGGVRPMFQVFSATVSDCTGPEQKGTLNAAKNAIRGVTVITISGASSALYYQLP